MGVEAQNQWVLLRGVLRYDPGNSHVTYKGKKDLGEAGLRKKRKHQLIVELKSRDLCRLYMWFYEKRYWVKLQEIMLMPHVNVLRRQESDDETWVPHPRLWKKYEGQAVEIEYSPLMEQHWKFHVLPVRSKRLDSIRRELGLGPRKGMHITFARDPDWM